MAFYLPYALDWARAGRIFVDTTLVTPYYANNFLTLYAAFFKVGLGEYTNFLPWFCGALSALGIFSTVRACALSVTNQARPLTWLTTTAIPLAVVAPFAFEPTFLRWANAGMLDVCIGCFIFLPVMATALTLIDRRTDYTRELVILAAFVAGMKPPLLAFLPLFGSLLILLSVRRLPKLRIVACFATFAAPKCAMVRDERRSGWRPGAAGVASRVASTRFPVLSRPSKANELAAPYIDFATTIACCPGALLLGYAKFRFRRLWSERRRYVHVLAVHRDRLCAH